MSSYQLVHLTLFVLVCEKASIFGDDGVYQSPRHQYPSSGSRVRVTFEVSRSVTDKGSKAGGRETITAPSVVLAWERQAERE